MSELFPANDYLENLSGTTEPLTGVYYPVKGEGLDWYASFAKCVYRLVSAASPAAALRVYKTGNLVCGIKAGQFFDGSTLRSFAGTESQALADNTTSYLYLLPNVTLTVNTTGFPDPAAQRHLRLASITTSGGTYSDDAICDARGSLVWNVAGPAAELAGGSVSATTLSAALAGEIFHPQILIGTELTNTIGITIQTRDTQNTLVSSRFLYRAWLSDTAYGPETATAPSGTVEVLQGTLLSELTTQKHWQLISADQGQAVLSITETGARTWFLNVEYAGKIIASSPITFQ